MQPALYLRLHSSLPESTDHRGRPRYVHWIQLPTNQANHSPCTLQLLNKLRSWSWLILPLRAYWNPSRRFETLPQPNHWQNLLKAPLQEPLKRPHRHLLETVLRRRRTCPPSLSPSLPLSLSLSPSPSLDSTGTEPQGPSRPTHQGRTGPGHHPPETDRNRAHLRGSAPLGRNPLTSTDGRRILDHC